MFTSVLALRYEVSYVHAAKGLMQEGILTGITWFVALYDPSDPKPAQLAPAVNPPLDFVTYDRIEQVLQDPVVVSTMHRDTLHVQRVSNEKIVYSSYKFAYQTFDEPRLHALRM